LQLLADGLGEEQAELALELLSPPIGADARPGQQVCQLPAFVGIVTVATVNRGTSPPSGRVKFPRRGLSSMESSAIPGRQPRPAAAANFVPLPRQPG
jgi:hypothetical protein